MANIGKVLSNIFFEPRLAFTIFVFFIFGYLVLLDKEGAFTKKFLNLGPDEETKFITMKINTWPKVIIVYLIGFFSSLLTAYYGNVSYDFIHSYIWNPAYKDTIQVSKFWTSLIVTIEPLLYWILQILNFFVNLTFELQFIVPKFLGQVIVDIPYGIFKVNQKKYKS